MTSYFLKLDGITGESVNARHQDEIEVDSFTFGESNTSTLGSGSGGSGVGKVVFETFDLVARASVASPALFLACAQGRRIRTARLVAARPGKNPFEFLTWTLDDVLLASYHESGSFDGVLDRFSLAFARVQISYTRQKTDGSTAAPVTATWDAHSGSGSGT